MHTYGPNSIIWTASHSLKSTQIATLPVNRILRTSPLSSEVLNRVVVFATNGSFLAILRFMLNFFPLQLKKLCG